MHLQRTIAIGAFAILSLISRPSLAEMVKLACQMNSKYQKSSELNIDQVIPATGKVDFIVDVGPQVYAERAEGGAWERRPLSSIDAGKIVLSSFKTETVEIREEISRVSGKYKDSHISEAIVEFTYGECKVDDSLVWPESKF